MVASLRKLLPAVWVQPQRQLSIPMRSVWSLALAVVACGTMLFIAQSLLLTTQRPTLRIAAASREADLLLDGFHATERDERGRYRWSESDSHISFPAIATNGPLVLRLELGPSPVQMPSPTFSLSYNATSVTTISTDERARRFLLLVPPEVLQDNALTVGLHSPVVRVQPDPRPIGLRFEAASLGTLGGAVRWVPRDLIGVQFVVLGLSILLLRQLAVPYRWTLAALLMTTLAVGWLASFQPLLFSSYLVRLMWGLALLVVLTVTALPLIARGLRVFAPIEFTRVLWGIAMLASAIRLSGVLYPTFAAHDLALNIDRLLKTASGTLLILNTSFEFGRGVTIYPPAPYLVLLPGVLLGLQPGPLVAGGIALLDGFGALAVGLLAHVLGAGRRGAIFCALLYAGMPISLSALYFGHTAQAFGQALTVPIALALLLALRGSDARGWLIATVLLLMSMLSHIGVTILAVAWLGIAWLTLLPRRVVPLMSRWRFGLVLGCACVLALALIYASVVSSHIEQTRAIGEEVASEGYEPSYWLIAQGFWIAFHSLGLVLLPIGLLLLRRFPIGGRELVGAWVIVVCLFGSVELATGLQVRYIYFLTPLACVAIGRLLDRLAARGIGARWIAWSIVLVLLFQGSALWYAGTFTGARISMVSLLR